MNLNRKLRDVAQDLSESGDETALSPQRALSGKESARMREMARYGIRDTPPDGAFDRVAAIAAKLFGVPMATVSIVDTWPAGELVPATFLMYDSCWACIASAGRAERSPMLEPLAMTARQPGQ